MMVAPSVTLVGAEVTVAAAVVVVVAPDATVVTPAGTVVTPSTSTPPASLSSIERKIRKPTTTAIRARTIVSGEPTGDPESPTRVEVRLRSALTPTPPGSVGSLIVYLPDAHAPPCCCLGERVVPSVVSGGPSINDRLRRKRRRWKRRTTRGSWCIAPGCSKTWSSSASYSSGRQPKRSLISSSRPSSNSHQVRSKSSSWRCRSVRSPLDTSTTDSLTRVHTEVEDGA